MKKTYDTIIIPTGEPSQDQEFPVTRVAADLFIHGKSGSIFVTGGYGGFAKKIPEKTEAEKTVEYLMKFGISPDKIYSDSQSLDTLGNFTFPEVNPQGKNPRFSDLDSILIIGQQGHMWRAKDYLDIVFPDNSKIEKIGFYELPGKHNDGILTRIYHTGFMNVLKNNKGAEQAQNFLLKNHPFYSEGWYEQSVGARKLTMALTGLDWLLK